MENNRLKQYKEDKQAQCSYRLFDRCDAPNCNMRCPNYMMAFRPIEKDYNTEANMYRPTGDDINTNNPEIREEILTRQRWLALATCKQLFRAFYYGSLGDYIGLRQSPE